MAGNESIETPLLRVTPNYRSLPLISKTVHSEHWKLQACFKQIKVLRRSPLSL